LAAGADLTEKSGRVAVEHFDAVTEADVTQRLDDDNL
jgi:hypothetical protein